MSEIESYPGWSVFIKYKFSIFNPHHHSPGWTVPYSYVLVAEVSSTSQYSTSLQGKEKYHCEKPQEQSLLRPTTWSKANYDNTRCTNKDMFYAHPHINTTHLIVHFYR